MVIVSAAASILMVRSRVAEGFRGMVPRRDETPDSRAPCVPTLVQDTGSFFFFLVPLLSS